MKYDEIKWEDDDNELEWQADKKSRAQKQMQEAEDFASMLSHESPSRQRIVVGETVTGPILSINPSSQTVLVELDAQNTGVLDYRDIFSEGGEQRYFAGDSITAYVVSRRGGEVILSLSLSQSKRGAQDLQMAHENQVPVKGKVTGENPGGFDVTIFGKRCFCPASQMDLRFVQNKADYIGKDFDFLIDQFEEGGRNIVVSRAKLLKRQAAEKIEQLEANLNNDPILTGVVQEVRDYGAFVDIGGMDGFLHISEMSYARLSRASDFVAKGDQVKVKVIKIEDTGDKKRISLSMKAIDDDPWLTASERYKDEGSYSGKVTRLEPYGAFVELEPGIEGLVHISEMSWGKRIHHPGDVLKVGDQVSVRVLSLDNSAKKISLSLKNIEDDPWLQVERELTPGTTHTGVVESLKGFGAIVQLNDGLVSGLLPMTTLKKAFGESYRKQASPPKELQVTIRTVDSAERKILLGLPDIEEEGQEADDFREYLARKKEKTASPKPSERGSFGDLLAKSLESAKKDK